MKQIDKLYIQANTSVFSATGIMFNTVVSTCSAAFIVSVLELSWVIWQIAVFVALAHLISIGLYSLSIAIIMMKNHDPNISPEEEVGELDDGEEIYAQQVELTIQQKSEPVGKFNGGDIFDWVDLTGGQETVRYEYFGTIRDGEDMNWVPDGSVILPPGVIYIPQKAA